MTYESTTKMYAEHFDATLEALQRYKYGRPWLEKGEKLSVPYSNMILKLVFWVCRLVWSTAWK